MGSRSKLIGTTPRNQAGVVLVVSLIILLLLTLIGLTGMQTTSLEEKMAGNLRDKNQAFQMAEAVLKVGEDKAKVEALKALKDDKGGGGFNCLPENQTDGLFKQAEPVIDIGTAHSVWSTRDVLCADDLKKVGGLKSVCRPDDVHQAKYVIQCLPESGLYRITAYAKGATNDSVVILQSVFNTNSPSL